MSDAFWRGFIFGFTAFLGGWLVTSEMRRRAYYADLDKALGPGFSKSLEGGIEEDYRQVGDDMYRAMSQFADKHFAQNDRHTTH